MSDLHSIKIGLVEVGYTQRDHCGKVDFNDAMAEYIHMWGFQNLTFAEQRELKAIFNKEFNVGRKSKKN